MSGGLAILVWSCGPQQPELLATPFMAAQAAAALELEVGMLFAAQSAHWLLADNQDTLVGFGPDRMPLRHYLDATAAMGIEIRACSQALRALGRDPGALAPQCAGSGGMVAFIEQGQAPGWRSLVF